MNKVKILLLFFMCSVFSNRAQKTAALQRFSDTTLFNRRDTACFNVSGEWTGEEIQYDPTQSFIKVKFKVVFTLKQEGNRVYGTSYIEDKYRGSYGDMKIRGIVTGGKLHFEEYEIVDEKFYQPGVVWCLRSGEMDIKIDGNTATLAGLSYDGYASDTYAKCTDYAKMAVSKQLESPRSATGRRTSMPKEVINGNYSGNIKMRIYPNPCVDATTISYELKEPSKVRIDVFSLSGAHIETIGNEQEYSGSQQLQLNVSAYAPGVYLVRLHAGNLYSTGQVVKSK